LAYSVFALFVPFVAIPLIIAHRGASAKAPENTLAAFQRAIALKADGIELDVQLSRDGVPVVFHDTNLLRLTRRRGRLTAKTWPEIQEFRILGSKEGVPSLFDVLTSTRGRIVVQVELKRGVAVAPVIAAIKKARAAAWVILASFEQNLLRDAADLAPAIPRMVISEGRGLRSSLLRRLRACDARGVSVNYRAVRKADYLSYFQARGFVVWCWTVNDAATARRLTGWGIDGLLGDNPALLKRLI
jgi:glycerophosphoryl diester phosphodiesterase